MKIPKKSIRVAYKYLDSDYTNSVTLVDLKCDLKAMGLEITNTFMDKEMVEHLCKVTASHIIENEVKTL